VPLSTKVILSHHDYDETPSDEVLEALVKEMFKAGADIAKIATTAQRIEDSARMLALPGKSKSSGEEHLGFSCFLHCKPDCKQNTRPASDSPTPQHLL